MPRSDPARPRFAMVDPRRLRPHPRNPRRITDDGLGKIREAIRRYGFTRPVVVQEGTEVLIAGHQATRAAVLEGLERIPAYFVPVDDERALAVLLADNRLAEEATWDETLLADIFREIGAEEARAAGFAEAEFERVMAALEAQVGTGAARSVRVSIDWDALSVFHTVLPSMAFVVDRVHYRLVAATAGDERPRWPKPERSLVYVAPGTVQAVGRWGSHALDRLPQVMAFAESVGADFVEQVDVPPTPDVLSALGMTLAQAHDRSIACAQELIAVLGSGRPRYGGQTRPVLTVHGPEMSDYHRAATDLARFAPPSAIVAVGGFRGAREHGRVCEVITMLREVLPGRGIHLQGVSHPPTAAAAIRAGATSVDTSSASLLAWNHLLVPVRRHGAFGTRKLRMDDLLDAGRLSLGGKLYAGLASWNLVIGTAAVLMSALAEELALYLEGGLTVSDLGLDLTEDEEAAFALQAADVLGGDVDG